ncbi:MAG: putative toxin [Pseudomonadota bacterium]
MSNVSFHPYLRWLRGNEQDDRADFSTGQGVLPPLPLTQTIVGLPALETGVLPPSAPPTGLEGFRLEQPSEIKSFRAGPWDAVPGFHLNENEELGRARTWPDGMEWARPELPDITPTSNHPFDVQQQRLPAAQQLSDWLYPAATALPGSASLPAVEIPSWQAGIVPSSDAANAPAGYPDPIFQPTNWGARAPLPLDSGLYARTGGDERQAPSGPLTRIDVFPVLPVGPPPGSDVIPADSGRATGLKAPFTPSDAADTGQLPEPQTEEELSRFIEEHGRAATDLFEAIGNEIADFGTRFYEDSVLKARDDITRLVERFAVDPVKTTLSVLNSFPQTRIEGEFLASFAAVFTILANAKKGLEFERSVIAALNTEKNTTKIGIEGLGRSVPDILRKGITEIKTRQEVNNSLQIRVQIAYARLFKLPFNLIVSPTTKRISKNVKDAVEQTGGTIRRYDPATGRFTPYE